MLPKEVGSWLVEGIGEDFIPKIADFSLVKQAYSITDHESFVTARRLLSETGILAGSSSGALIAAAIRYCKEQTTRIFELRWILQENLWGFTPIHYQCSS